jgi:riboflavin biosynthesis pyrimidine reductase
MTTTDPRPRVICHMTTSVDGRIVVDGWPAAVVGPVRRAYEQIHTSYDADGWLCGRVTMEPFAKHVRSEQEVAREHPSLRSGQRPPAREDFVAPGDFEAYAFALDAHGRLAWASNDIDGDHVVALLSERVSDEYLAFLRERGVSYLLAGERDVDLALALRKITARFGVRALMLEGGGRINGAMLRAGLVDEVSVLVAPVADGRTGLASLFDGDDLVPRRLSLAAVQQLDDDVLWLRYRVEPTGEQERGTAS